jgi:hypothetical protein
MVRQDLTHRACIIDATINPTLEYMMSLYQNVTGWTYLSDKRVAFSFECEVRIDSDDNRA